MGQLVFLARDFKPAFGCAFFALFRNDADGVWLVTQGDLLHLIGCRHLKIKRHGQNLHQPINIRVRNMAAVFAQMRRDAIRPGLLRQLGRAQRIRISAAARISHGCNVIDVHAQTQICVRHQVIPSALFGPSLES